MKRQSTAPWINLPQASTYRLGKTVQGSGASSDRISRLKEKVSLNPEFAKYLVEIYDGKTAKLVMDNELSKTYPTTLKEYLNSRGPIFAGEYVVAEWGCGTACYINAFVSIKTGKTLEETFGGECGIFVKEFRPDSRLLIAEGDYFDETTNTLVFSEFRYVLENSEFKKIARIEKTPPKDDIRFGRSCG